MANNNHPLVSPRIRFWRYLPLLIILGLAVHLLLPQITTLEESWSVIQKMIWWLVVLALIAQALSYLGSGYMLHAILETNQGRLSVFRGILITMASYSIGLVAGGWLGGAAATYGWVRRESHDRNTAILAGALPALLNNAVLVGVALIGTCYLILVHDLTTTQLVEFGVILFVLAMIAVGVIAALNFPEPATRFIFWLAGHWSLLRRKPFEPQNIITSTEGFFLTWRHLINGNWLYPVLGAMANIGFDILTLYFMFIAAGQKISLGVLFAGYGLPLILGKMAFLFPGGVGVIEGSMAALYTSLKVPHSVSVVVILGYRLFSFWLPTVLGFVAAAYLSHNLPNTAEESA